MITIDEQIERQEQHVRLSRAYAELYPHCQESKQAQERDNEILNTLRRVKDQETAQKEYEKAIIATEPK
jgi:uncharacterized alpha-E superfamily protein